jgi:hypothetical protein
LKAKGGRKRKTFVGFSLGFLFCFMDSMKPERVLQAFVSRLVRVVGCSWLFWRWQ